MGGTRQAAQLAFFVLMTLPALLLLVAWGLSAVLDDPGVRADVIEKIVELLPLDQVEGREDVEKLLDGMLKGAGGLGFFGIVAVLYSASAAVGAFRYIVEQAFRRDRNPNFFQGKAIDLGVMSVTLPVALSLIALAASRPFVDAIDANPTLADVIDVLGAPVAVGVLSCLLLAWLVWVLVPYRASAKAALAGAAVGILGLALVVVATRLYFGVTGGGSAIYGTIAGFLAVFVSVLLGCIVVAYGAHVAAVCERRWKG